MASQDLKSITREVKPYQWLVLAAWSLTLVALFFCLGGLLGVWWAGEVEQQIGPVKIEVAFAQTLWESTSEAGTASNTAKIDDMCDKDQLSDDETANCSKTSAIRAFMFLKLFAVFLALVCPVAWFVLQRLRGVDASSLLQKHLLTVSVMSNAFASLCAFVATCIAPSLNFGIDGVGAAGAGYVLTILSMIICLWPATILECYVWRREYHLSSGKTEGNVSSQPQPNLPTLVGTSAATKEDAVKVQSVSEQDVQAVTFLSL